MKNVITGGAGCIGSDLAETLVRRGDHVTVIDNLSSGRLTHIEPLLARENFRFVQADLLDPGALDAHFHGAEMVWHLAANPDVKWMPGDPTDRDLRQNVQVTYNVLEAVRRAAVPGFAFTSTSAVYGICERQPIPEWRAPAPISLYGASKAACEALISAFHHLFGIRCRIFRLANVVSGKTRARGSTVIGDFIRKLRENPARLEILGDGRQSKSYLLASECVEAMLFVAEHAPEGLALYNVGGQDAVPVRHIADMVVDALGLKDVEYVFSGTAYGWPGDVPGFVLDAGKLNRLGWRARYGSEEAVRRAISEAVKEGAAAACRR